MSKISIKPEKALLAIVIICDIAFIDVSWLMILVHLIPAVYFMLRVKGIKKDYLSWVIAFDMLAGLSVLWSINTSTWLTSFLSIIQVQLIFIILYSYYIIETEEAFDIIVRYVLIGAFILCIRFGLTFSSTVATGGRLGQGVISTYSSMAVALSFCCVISFWKWINKKIIYMFCYVSLPLYAFF